MSNEVVNWAEKLAADAKAVAATERPASANISLRAGIMAYQGVAVPGNKLAAVIVGYAFERAYYTKAFDPNSPATPDCFALSTTGEAMIAHEASIDIQADNCAVCPRNAWQDNPKRPGKKHKECKEKRRLILIPGASIKDGEIQKAEMATMTIPVTSIKNWANYVNLCNSAYSRPPWAMLTEISVVPHMQNQFEVKFEAAGIVQDQFLGDISARVPQAEGLALTPYDPQPEAPQKEEPKGKKKY